MIDRLRTPYNEPLSSGDIVYYAGSEKPFSFASVPEVVTLGIVTKVHPADSYGGNLHVQALDPLTRKPLPGPKSAGLTPERVFTGEQALAEIVHGDSPLTEDTRTLAEIVADKAANGELARLLGAAALERLDESKTLSASQFVYKA